MEAEPGVLEQSFHSQEALRDVAPSDAPVAVEAEEEQGASYRSSSARLTHRCSAGTQNAKKEFERPRE
ncbi:hypothetical protein Q5P01_025724 [Channa striata]|uniref:Uncharacterized protein n=1 Tax=Channa striata TaxID=64152 RepID=A0AA88IXD1_CHASR|nr:hypothetical protein Q5P01_025724 [Channa striata]